MTRKLSSKRKESWRLIVGLLLASTVSIATSCSEANPTSPLGDDPDVTEPELALIEVSPNNLTLAALGSRAVLTAVASDAEGALIADVAFAWGSSDAGVATVSSAGEVTAIGFGSAVMTASAEGVTSNPVTVTVSPPPPPVGFSCTHVIGFSQTHGWYSAGFESVVDDDAWQEIWRPGGSIDLWADPGFDGWSRPVLSACASNTNDPDRVLLTISGRSSNDPNWWAGHIRNVISNIRDKYPTVQQIMLQPVVGGPNHQACSPNGVRASENHPVIDEAIGLVVGGDVIAGFSPEVRACGDYVDFVGHLTPDASAAVGVVIGQYYAAN